MSCLTISANSPKCIEITANSPKCFEITVTSTLTKITKIDENLDNFFNTNIIHVFIQDLQDALWTYLEGDGVNVFGYRFYKNGILQFALEDDCGLLVNVLPIYTVSSEVYDQCNTPIVQLTVDGVENTIVATI